MGIRVRAAAPAALLLPAAQALYEAIGQLVPRDDAEQMGLDLAGESQADLLRDYLSELLVLFDRDRRMVTRVDVQTYTHGRLAATAQVCSVDNDRSVFQREVKAITYHELEIRKIPEGHEATFIVDI